MKRITWLLVLTTMPTVASAQIATVRNDSREADLVLRERPGSTSNPQVGATFETVTIRPVRSSNGGRGTRRMPGGVFEATNISVRELIEFAYQRHAFDRREVIGGPAWIDSDHFDIVAKAANDPALDADGTPRQTLAMVQALLADHFAMRVHEDKKERDVYALTKASDGAELGPRVHPSDFDCSTLAPGKAPALAPGQHPPCAQKTPPGRLFANTVSMPILASLIARYVDRPVIDATGLAGRFDIELESSDIRAAPDYKPGPSDLALPPAAGPPIFTAVHEQLGLKLEARRALVSVIIIDAIAPPTPD
jgi:uncharacterized protein (TIGR03435 family)